MVRFGEIGIFVGFLTIQVVLAGRYVPPTDSKAYDFPFNKKVPTIDELIAKAGFVHDRHGVVTRDGHILTLHRLTPPNAPPGPRGTPVLFVNGFCFQSEGWMGLGRNTSIAFILSDLGYDVWLGDQRGTGRSIGHVNYKLDDPRTYSYSFHEMGVYDLPAFIDHILAKTGYEQLLYVGLSLGSGVFAVMEAEVPEYRDKVIAAVFLGPAIHLTNWSSTGFFYYNILRVVDSMIESQIQRKLWILFANQPLIRTAVSSCSVIPLNLYLSSCLTLVGLTLGPYTGNMNPKFTGFQLGSVLTSTSVFVARHLFQVLKHGEFVKYDFGDEKINMEVYGMPKPPKYDLSKVTTPLMVFYGTVDNMADPDAVQRSMHDMYSSRIERHLLKNFNHVDYLFGRKAPKLVYAPIVDYFDEMTGFGKTIEPSKSSLVKYKKFNKGYMMRTLPLVSMGLIESIG